MTNLEIYRQQKDRFFKNDPNSPLETEQQESFEGLAYFAASPDLNLVLDAEEFEEQEQITMQTSTGDLRDYLRWGRIRFEVEGDSAELTLYMALGGGFFLPFKDTTSGKETYGAGRYLEVEPQADGRFLVDFNMTYNPYCAYSERWSCPIPPQENHLKVAVRAGEKSFK